MGGSQPKFRLYSSTVLGTSSENHSSIYRNPESESLIVLPTIWGMSNYFDLFHLSCNKHNSSSLLGERVNSRYDFITYHLSSIRVIQLANAVDSLKINENSIGLKIICILSNPRQEALFLEIACFGVGIIPVSLHEKDSENDLLFKLNLVKPKYLAADSENFEKILKLKKEGLIRELEVVIVLDNLTETQGKIAEELGIRLLSYGECKNFDMQFSSKVIDIKGTAMILFTSGTVSQAKAVRISHESLMENLTGLVNAPYKLTTDDVFMSTNSLSVYSEKILIFSSVIFGSRIGISKNFLDDLKVLRPTIMNLSPRYLDYLYSQIQQDLSFESSITLKIFKSTYNKKLKEFNKKKDVKKQLLDSMAFNIVKEKFGGRVKLVFVDSGISNIETLKFFKIVVGCDIIESYGTVESGQFLLCSGRDYNYGNVGGPISSCELKLEYIPDLLIEGEEQGRYGELCIRQTTVPLGYLCEDLVDSENWLHTGDILKISESSGAFTFLERTDYVMKPKCGWAVLPQRLELLYRQSDLVAQIVLYTDSRINGLIAVVVPDESNVMKAWNGRVSDYKALTKSKDFSKFLLSALKDLATEKGLKAYEIIKEVIIDPQPWTSHEFITANLKVKRAAILKHYGIQILEAVQRLNNN